MNEKTLHQLLNNKFGLVFYREEPPKPPTIINNYYVNIDKRSVNITREEFEKLKAHFVAADAEAHKGKEGYKARMRIEVLSDVYLAIIEKFDPKG